MFSKEQLSKIEEAGFIGLPVEDCGSRLGMTSKKFLKEYEIDEAAQLAYEKGRCNHRIEFLITIDQKSDTEHKALDLAASIFGLKPTASSTRRASANEVSNNSESLDNALTNPLMLLMAGDEDTEEDDEKTKKKK